MKRRLQLLAVMVTLLVSIVASGLSSNTVCAFGFCEGCTQQCANESEGIYTDCMHQTTKPMQQCAQERDDYRATCNSIFCPACPLNH